MALLEAPDVQERSVTPGDVFLLCSDGLSNLVGDDKIAKTLSRQPDLEDCAQRLIHMANRGGGDDNISVVLISVNEDYKAEQDWQTQMIDWFTPR